MDLLDCKFLSFVQETAIEAEIAVEEKRLQSSFEDLIAAMEGYFGKILGQIQDSLM